MEERYIAALRKLKEKPVNDEQELEVWKSHATNALSRIFGPESKQVHQIQDIRFGTYPVSGRRDTFGNVQTYGGGNNVDKCKQQAYGLIDAFIDELETFGPPLVPKPETTDDRISITVNQNQHVSVNAVLEVFQKELTAQQIRELKEILEGEGEPNEKRQKLVDKVKSFSNDVLANVAAGVLANPQILSLFQTM